MKPKIIIDINSIPVQYGFDMDLWHKYIEEYGYVIWSSERSNFEPKIVDEELDVKLIDFSKLSEQERKELLDKCRP